VTQPVPEVVKNPVPGTWYRSDRHWPPTYQKFIVATADGQWHRGCISKQRPYASEFSETVAWQIPALPIAYFFECPEPSLQQAQGTNSNIHH
jgi:hypothetical protein